VAAVLGAAALLVVLVTWAASIGPDQVVSGGRVEREVRPDPIATATQTVDPGDPDDEARDRERGDTPGWVGVVALVLEVLTLAVALFLVGRLAHRLRQAWRSRTRRRRKKRVEEVEFDVLDSAVRISEAIEEDAAEQRALLVEELEPRNAIVAAWHRFEVQAARAGVVRRPWQTTGEFVLGVLDLVDADRGAVSRLADLYREARFSDHPITDDHRRDALEALDTVHRSLRIGVGAS
jgi:hypothetical protein